MQRKNHFNTKYSPEFKLSVIPDIDKLEEYIEYYNNERISLGQKRNESGAIPNSLTNILILKSKLRGSLHNMQNLHFTVACEKICY